MSVSHDLMAVASHSSRFQVTSNDDCDHVAGVNTSCVGVLATAGTQYAVQVRCCGALGWVARVLIGAVLKAVGTSRVRLCVRVCVCGPTPPLHRWMAIGGRREWCC